MEDTIAAIITSQGLGAVGAIRISGPEAFKITDRIYITKKGVKAPYLPKYSLNYGHVFDGDRIIDQALLLKMAGPYSYTGEDVIEIQCHGGPVILGNILDLIIKNGARLAEPGEFTKRAFLNGKIDLAQAEAVMDMVNASNTTAAKSAANALDGGLSTRIMEMKQIIINVLAKIEASIDFPDEDLEDGSSDTDVDIETITKDINEAVNKARILINESRFSNIYKDGLRLVFYGRPNVGKSSLLNVLLKQPRAIVTAEAGTTRDILEEKILLKGLPIILSDTAGIRETDNIAEKAGVDLAKNRATNADLTLMVSDISQGWTKEDSELYSVLDKDKTLVILNKSDIVSRETFSISDDYFKNDQVKNYIVLSAIRNDCCDKLSNRIIELYNGGNLYQGAISILNKRQIEALSSGITYLEQSLTTLRDNLGVDLVSIDLRNAWDSLSEITGESVNDSLIEEIFSRFCLGK